MKSYLFTTDDGRGGVILCDIDTMEDVVPYLQQRFKGVVRVEQGHSEWTQAGGFARFTPRPVTEVFDEEGVAADTSEIAQAEPVVESQTFVASEAEQAPVVEPGPTTGSLF